MKDIYIAFYQTIGYGQVLTCAIYCDKEFWDNNKYIDDSPEEDLIDAFSEVGLEEVATSELEWCLEEIIPMDDLINKMKNKGYNLLVNDSNFITEYKNKFGKSPIESVAY